MRLPSFGRVDVSRQSAKLVAGDLLAIAAFVAGGELRHGGTFSSGALTYAEFVAGWAIAAVLVGAYATDAIDSWGRAAGIAFLGWIGGALIGQLIRAILKPGFYVAPSFVAVSIAFGGLALVIWRVLAAALLRSSRSPSGR